MDNINILDKCFKYLLNYDTDNFIYRFFDIKKITITDTYIIEKINLLNNDFPRFWLSLDDENKLKFIEIIENKDETKYNIKKPKNLMYTYENGKKIYKFI
jgi:hypothetical protein